MHDSDHIRAEDAQLVLRGGTVLTLDAADTTAEAVAVRDGRIVALGLDRDVHDLIGPQTEVVELGGRSVIPGINDSHLHATWLGAMWPKTVFSRPDDGQGEARVADPHDEAESQALVTDEQERRDAVLRAGELIASLGITSYTEPGIGPGEDAGETGCFSQRVLDTYVALESEGLLRARVNVLALFGVLDGRSDYEAFERGLRAYSRVTARPDLLRVAGVKIFGDGIPPMLQAWTHHDYPDGGHGDLLVDGDGIDDKAENLRRMIRLAHGLGYQVGVHATGDRTIETMVEAVEQAWADEPAELRHYVIHGDLTSRALLRRMARVGMGLNMQAGIAALTSPWVAGVLGDEVMAQAWPIRDAMAEPVPLSLSSDAPILSPDWRRGIVDAHAWMGPATDARARTRALLRAYTAVPAWQDGAETWKGTLEVGKVGDLCVLDADPFEAGAENMTQVGIDLTVMGGRTVFDRALAASA